MPLLPTRCSLLLLLLLLLTPTVASAQEDEDEEAVVTAGPGVRLALGGLLQTRFSYGTEPRDDLAGAYLERYGFGIKRARLSVRARLSDAAGAFVQVEAAGGTLQPLDFVGYYQVNERLRLQLGRFVMPEPRAAILTPAPLIDAVDRPVIAERWGALTIGADGRDFGLGAVYQQNRIEWLLAVHNGDGDWGRLRGNFRSGITGARPTDGVEQTGLAYSIAAAYRPAAAEDVEIGAYGGYNFARNPNTALVEQGRSYASYAAHAYWGVTPGSQPVRLKVDLLGIRYEKVIYDTTEPAYQQHVFGAALLGAVHPVEAAEVFARGEWYTANLRADDIAERFFTGGISFSPSALRGGAFARERLTLGYSAYLPAVDTGVEHLLILQAQLVF